MPLSFFVVGLIIWNAEQYEFEIFISNNQFKYNRKYFFEILETDLSNLKKQMDKFLESKNIRWSLLPEEL